MIDVVIWCILVISASAEVTDYCRLSTALCPVGAKHIACNNNGGFAAKCGQNPTIFPLTIVDKEAIVRVQNRYRYMIASGVVSMLGHPATTKMASLAWDDELASMAEYNAKTCLGKLDLCHNTCKFPVSGQLVKEYSFDFSQDVSYNAIYALIAVAVQYGTSPPDFKVMMTHEYTHVGCASLMYWIGSNCISQIICNYGTLPSNPASQCPTGNKMCTRKESHGVLSVC